MLNKILSDKISGTKNAFFSLWWAPTHPSLLLKCDSSMNWRTRLVSLKMCMGKIIEIIEKPHTVLLPDFRFLSCNKKF